MAEHYPELLFGSDPVTGCEAFEGVLPLVAVRSGVVRRVPVRIIFPVGYPDDEPRAFDHTDRFLPHTAVRHFYSGDGRCCLWLPWDSRWQPSRHDGLLDFMAHLSIFFHHQLIFDVSGQWPVPARGHGRNGYASSCRKHSTFHTRSSHDSFRCCWMEPGSHICLAHAEVASRPSVAT
jgi:hypothetical protein